MKNIICLTLLILGITTQVTGQEFLLTPENNPADIRLITSETSNMSWYMVSDSTEIKIGDVQTEIQKEKDKINIITTVLILVVEK